MKYSPRYGRVRRRSCITPQMTNGTLRPKKHATSRPNTSFFVSVSLSGPAVTSTTCASVDHDTLRCGFFPDRLGGSSDAASWFFASSPSSPSSPPPPPGAGTE